MINYKEFKLRSCYRHPFNNIRLETSGKSCVYIIINHIVPERIYIGSVIGSLKHPFRIYDRFREHFYSNTNTNIDLKKDMDKYNMINFSFNILEYSCFSKLGTRALEEYYLNNVCLKEAYNVLGNRNSKYLKENLRSSKKCYVFSLKTGCLIGTYKSLKDLSLKYGIPYRTAQRYILLNKEYKKLEIRFEYA